MARKHALHHLQHRRDQLGLRVLLAASTNRHLRLGPLPKTESVKLTFSLNPRSPAR
jgi:hypothetical protein